MVKAQLTGLNDLGSAAHWTLNAALLADSGSIFNGLLGVRAALFA
jgi:hypothetical protein